MKRVLQVLSTLEQGGTESVVLNYVSNINSSAVSFDFLVLWGKEKGYYEDYLKAQGHNVYRMTAPPDKLLAHTKELKAFFADNKYDIVHIHAMTAMRYVVAEAAKKSGVSTVIFHSHNTFNERHMLLHKLLRHKLDKWCDYRFACSDAAGRYMFRGGYTVINNAIDIDKFAFDAAARAELRRRYGLEDKLVIGNVGRLTEVKNQIFLLKCAKYIKAIKSDFALFIIGNGATRDMLTEYAESNGLKDNLIICDGVGRDVYRYYSMFDVLAFPSKFEGLSVVLIEAQANGVPVVASDRITPENKAAENLWFLPIDENEDCYKTWAERICEAAESRRDNSADMAAHGFDIKIEAKKLEEFYLAHGVSEGEKK